MAGGSHNRQNLVSSPRRAEVRNFMKKYLRSQSKLPKVLFPTATGMVLRSEAWRLGSKLNIVSIVRSLSVLLVLLGSAFTVCATYLIPHKAPWVDEMYTWYGIHHDNFGQFWDSIGSGINYSPPLYFFLNWILQLFLPLSLNALRVESLLWILGGTVLVYLTLRKQLGSPTALLGVGCVLLQSSLLFGQSLEARSYGLFFFCGAAVLYTGQSLTIDKGKRSTWAWAFIAHLAPMPNTLFGNRVFGIGRTLSIPFNRQETQSSSMDFPGNRIVDSFLTCLWLPNK